MTFTKSLKKNGDISLQSFNIYGELQWGRILPMPQRIVEGSIKPGPKQLQFSYWIKDGKFPFESTTQGLE